MHTSAPSTHNTPKPENPDFKTELLGLVPFLRAFARSLTGNQEAADDLAQETLVKAWQSRASFIPGTNLLVPSIGDVFLALTGWVVPLMLLL